MVDMSENTDVTDICRISLQFCQLLNGTFPHFDDYSKVKAITNKLALNSGTKISAYKQTIYTHFTNTFHNMWKKQALT